MAQGEAPLSISFCLEAVAAAVPGYHLQKSGSLLMSKDKSDVMHFHVAIKF